MYNLYIDECGDHYLATYDRNFPIFTLCGILIPVKKVNELKAAIDNVKMEFWHTTEVILHSRDIRKCEKHFQILFDNDIKQRFYTRINDILSRQNIYTVICCTVLKEDCIRQHGPEADVYGTALKYVLQRSIFCTDDLNEEAAKINVIVERRGKREDAALVKYFNALRVKGMHYVTPDRFNAHIENFKFSEKKENIFGLQIADLIAYPISRHVMNPEKNNPAFEIIAPNIYKCESKLLGLKIFPDK